MTWLQFYMRTMLHMYILLLIQTYMFVNHEFTYLTLNCGTSTLFILCMSFMKTLQLFTIICAFYRFSLNVAGTPHTLLDMLCVVCT